MKRIHLEIVLGTIFVFVSVAILIVMSSAEGERLSTFESMQIAESVEFGAAVFETNCTSCHGSHAQGIPGKAPCLRCPELFETRMAEIGWQGSLEEYIVSVVTTGRQISTRPGLYQGEGAGPPVMPTWSEKFGGPLRDDQINAVAAFIVNYQEWADNPEAVPTPLVDFGDTSDPVVLGRLAMTTYGCFGCHAVEGISVALTGPAQDGVATRAAEHPGYESAEDYIRTSILNPSEFVVEGYQDGLMPQNFSELISDEDLDHIVAYLLTLTDE